MMTKGLNGLKFRFKRALQTIIASALLAGLGAVTSNAASEGGKEAIQWDTKEIGGETYVKAADVVKSIGGSGSYNQQTNRYTYNPPERISSIVKGVSPSIVGIIGKDASSDSRSADNRYDLIHGTGVIVKADGWIVTNAHVVKDMKQIIVVTADGKQYAGKKSSIDEESDLALVQIDASDLHAATLSEETKIDVGDTVIAIGTPISFALRNSVTVGVISGIDRSIHSTYRLLQTDAAINPGNSGGALVNEKGEVIGINSLKFAAVGVDGLGFAIPADTVEYVLNQFYTYGKVKRPGLGFEIEESWAAIVGLPTNDPLKVSRVDPGSSAEKAGIHEGDVLYSLDQVNINTLVDLNELLKKYAPGDKVKLTLQSDGDIVQKEITFTEKK